jgi:nucleoside-diphosphate-sugar epimerase
MTQKTNIIITGASGFLGGRTAAFFAQNFPQYQVIATSRTAGKKASLENLGCQYMLGDLQDQSFCDSITKDASIVIHCAALSSPYGQYEKFHQSNIVATQTLLDASKANGVNKFIYISTPSIYVSFNDRFNVSENDPLPKKMVNDYARTKLIAEKLVLAANSDALSTIALRPRAIIGAEDTVIFPRIFEAYKKGKLKVIGSGNNICDLTCVRNVIEAITLSIDADHEAYGQAYNITDGKSVDFWQTLNGALNQLGYQNIDKKVNKKIAMIAATVVERYYKTFKPNSEPAITKYGIAILADNFTLDISKAKSLLRYKPVMTSEDGINEFIKWYKKTPLN